MNWIDIVLTLPVLLLLVAIVVCWLGSCGIPFPGRWFLRRQAAHNGEPSAAGAGAKKQLALVFFWAVFTRVLIYFLAWLVAFFSKNLQAGNVFSLFRQWDANAYLRIIEHGYSFYTENGQHLDLVFFPLYAWVVKPFAWLLGDALMAGCMVSVLCFAWGCCWLYRLSAFLHGKKAAKYAVLLASLFPFSLFFGGVMTEGLFFLTTTAALYFAIRHKWAAFAAWGILAAATRMTGILLIVPALMELLQSHLPIQRGEPAAKQAKRLPGRILCILLPLLGTGIYLLVNGWVEGNPFIFLTYQKHWYQGGMWFSQVLQYVFAYFMQNLTTAEGFAIWYPTLLLFPLVFFLLVAAWKAGGTAHSLLAYGLLYLLANYSLSWLLSAGRYLSCGCVFFLFAGKLFEKRTKLRNGILIVSSALLGLYVYAYISGGFVM